MNDLLNSPLFGIIISIIAYEIGLFLYRKTKISLFNPLLMAIILVIVLLKLSGISFDTYNKGGGLISIFLGPATVILAVPLYKQIELLKKDFMPITVSIFIGCMTALASVWAFSKVLGLDSKVFKSLLPKSITTPIGMELSRQIGGIPALTVATIILTGIVGAVISPFVLKVFRITDKVAKGIAIGTSSHAVGTTKAVEMGEAEGAMSGLSIGVAGLVTVIITTILFR